MKKLFHAVLFFICFFSSSSLFAYAPEVSKAMDLIYGARFDEAEKVINGYISAHPQDPMGLVVRGTLFDWKQLVHGLKSVYNDKILADYQQANLNAFIIWDKDQNNLDKMVDLGNTYLFLSKKWLDMGKTMRAGLILKKCQKHLEAAVQKDPNRYDAYMANGIFNFYAGNLPAGLSALAGLLGISGDETKGLEMVSKTANNPNLFQNHATFVLSYMYGQTKKNYKQAQAVLEKLTTKFPENPYFFYLKGEYAMRDGQYEKSRQIFSSFDAICKSHTCSPNHVFLKNFFMAEGFFKENKIMEAAPYVELAIQQNTHAYKDRDSFLDYYKGMILKKTGKASEAKVLFQKVLDASEGSKSAKELAAKELSAS